MSEDSHHQDGQNERSFLLESHERQKSSPPPNQLKQASLSRKVVVLIACFYMQTVCVGISTSLGVLYTELIDRFSAPRAQAALVQSIYMGVMTGGGVMFTTSIERFGPGLNVMLGTLLSTVALIVSSQASSVFVVIIFNGFIAGVGESVAFLGSFVAVSQTFTSSRKLALAAVTLSATVGQSLFPVVSDTLLQTYGFTGTFIMLAGIAFQSFVWGMVLHTSREYFSTVDPQENKSNDSNKPIVSKRMVLLKDAVLIQLIFSSFVYSATGPVEQWFLVDIAVLRGYTRQAGSTLLTLLGIFGFVGRVLAGVLLRIIPKISSAVYIVCGLISYGFAHLLVILLEDMPGMTGAIVLRGISAGIYMALQPSLQLELRGIQRYAITVALCNLASGVANITGGYFGGLIADVTGTYNVMFYISACGSWVVAVSVFSLWLCRIRKRPYQ